MSRTVDEPPPTSRDRFVFKNRTRFIILLICTLCLSIAQSNTLTLNFTIICMAGEPINIDQYNTSGTIHETSNGTYFEVSACIFYFFHSPATPSVLIVPLGRFLGVVLTT